MSEITENQSSSAVMNTYNRFPVNAVKGKGSFLFDDKGNKYLDYTSGIAVCSLGHVPAPVQQALSEQVDTLWHCSNLYTIPQQEELANALITDTCFDRVFYCNSGAEANEAAIKLAKKYAKDNNHPERTEIVTFDQSFHGRTSTTMAATAQEKIHQGFTPIAPGFRYLPYNDDSSIAEIPDGKTTAVLLELVQGEGGVHPVDGKWVKKIAEMCKENDILLMIDEVQTGIGRTGTLFAYEQYGIEPDVITLAKGLGSGFPIGAMLAKEKAAASFTPGTHGSTFGGNPLATTAAKATLLTIKQEQVLEKTQEKAKWLHACLAKLKQDYPNQIEDVRGLGMLIGVQTKEPANLFIQAFRDKGILTMAAGANVLRILPPLTTSQEEMEFFIDTFKQVLEEVEAS